MSTLSTTSADITQTPETTTEAQATPTERAFMAAGLLGMAAIHLADLPDKLEEVPYLGVAYIGMIAASLILIDLVVRRGHLRYVAASAALSLAVIVGFVVNRTVGMPNAMDDIGNWGEPLGLVSLLVEGMVAWVGARAWLAHRR